MMIEIPSSTRALMDAYNVAVSNSILKCIVDEQGMSQFESTSVDECVYRGEIQLPRHLQRARATGSALLKCALCLQAHHVAFGSQCRIGI